MDNKVDDIVDMIDNFIVNGGGHVNVVVNGEDATEKSVETMKSSDCAGPNMACKVPTLHVGIDDIENE